MPRFTIFIGERVVSTGYMRPRTGLSNVFLQPQPNISSSNPSSKSADSDSITLTESSTNPGTYYADDLYVGGAKQGDFNGSTGFMLPSSKSIYFKRNVLIDSTSYETAMSITVGSGVMATPDGGQTWPKFSTSNLPMVVILEPSESVSGFFMYRSVKMVRNSLSVSAGGVLSFQVVLDPNGPDLAKYYCDILIIMP
jgi:hypothetical protein